MWIAISQTKSHFILGLQTSILLMSAPNHPMALHLLWGKSKILSKSFTIRPQDFYGIISCYCPLITLIRFSSFFHLALPSISLGLCTPVLLQANPHWFLKTQLNQKPSATLSLILQARDGPCLICDLHRALHICSFFQIALIT